MTWTLAQQENWTNRQLESNQTGQSVAHSWHPFRFELTDTVGMLSKIAAEVEIYFDLAGGVST